MLCSAVLFLLFSKPSWFFWKCLNNCLLGCLRPKLPTSVELDIVYPENFWLKAGGLRNITYKSNKCLFSLPYQEDQYVTHRQGDNLTSNYHHDSLTSLRTNTHTHTHTHTRVCTHTPHGKKERRKIQGVDRQLSILCCFGNFSSRNNSSNSNTCKMLMQFTPRASFTFHTVP